MRNFDHAVREMEMDMEKHQCTCAVCMGFEPWVTDFAECMITRFIKTGQAVLRGEACNIVEGHDLTCRLRVIEREWAEAIGAEDLAKVR